MKKKAFNDSILIIIMIQRSHSKLSLHMETGCFQHKELKSKSRNKKKFDSVGWLIIDSGNTKTRHQDYYPNNMSRRQLFPVAIVAADCTDCWCPAIHWQKPSSYLSLPLKTNSSETSSSSSCCCCRSWLRFLELTQCRILSCCFHMTEHRSFWEDRRSKLTRPALWSSIQIHHHHFLYCDIQVVLYSSPEYYHSLLHKLLQWVVLPSSPSFLLLILVYLLPPTPSHLVKSWLLLLLRRPTLAFSWFSCSSGSWSHCRSDLGNGKLFSTTCEHINKQLYLLLFYFTSSIWYF